MADVFGSEYQSFFSDYAPKEEQPGAFRRGIQMGLENLGAQAYGLRALHGTQGGMDISDDLDKVAEFQSKVQQLSRPTDEWSGVHTPGEFGSYVANQAGQLLPAIGAALVPGLRNARAGAAFLETEAGKTLIQRGIAKGLSEAESRAAVESAMRKAGMDIGMGAVGAEQGIGTLYPELARNNDPDAIERAQGFGAVSGVVGMLPGIRAANKLVGGTMGAAENSYLGRLARETFQQGALGAAAGVGQNVVNREALRMDQSGEDALTSNINAAFAGGIGGALLSPVAALHRNIRPGTDPQNLLGGTNEQPRPAIDVVDKTIPTQDWVNQQVGVRPELSDAQRRARISDLEAAFDEPSPFRNVDRSTGMEMGPKSIGDLFEQELAGRMYQRPNDNPLAIPAQTEMQRRILGQQGADPTGPIHLLGDNPAPRPAADVQQPGQTGPSFMQIAADAYRRQQQGALLSPFEAAAARQYEQAGAPQLEIPPRPNLKPEPQPPAPLPERGMPQRSQSEALRVPAESEFAQRFLGQRAEPAAEPIALPEAAPEPKPIVGGPTLEQQAMDAVGKAARGELLTQQERDLVNTVMERQAPAIEQVPAVERRTREEPAQPELPGIEKPITREQPQSVEKLTEEQEARGKMPGQHEMFDRAGEPTYGAAPDAQPDFERLATAVAKEARYNLTERRKPLAVEIERARHEGRLTDNEADALHSALSQSKYGFVEKGLKESTEAGAKAAAEKKAGVTEESKREVAARKEAEDTWNESYHTDGEPTFNKLPRELQDTWTKAVSERKATTELYDSLVRQAEDSEWKNRRALTREKPVADDVQVKRASDFRESGEYEVTVGGKTGRMFRDPESGNWYRADAGGENTHYSRRLLGFNKTEATAAMAKYLSGEEVSAARSQDLAHRVEPDILSKLTDGTKLVDHLAAEGRSPVVRDLAKRLARLPELANVRVFTDTPELRAKISENARRVLDTAQAVYLHGPNAIISREHSEVVLLHELVHAATVRRLRTDAAARGAFERFMSAAKRSIEQRYGKESLRQLEGGVFENLDEFVAYGFTDPRFRALLADVRLPADKTLSVWQRFVGLVRRVLGMPERQAGFDQVMDTPILEQMDTALDEMLARDGNLIRDDDTVSAAKEWDLTPEKAASVAREAPRQFAESMSINNLGRLRRGKLAMMFSRDIADNYGSTIKGPEGESLVKKYVDTAFRMGTTANELLKTAGDAINRWGSVRDVDALNELAWKSTVMGINPDEPISASGANRHLIKDGRVADDVRANHASLRAAWEKLSPEGKASYKEVRKLLADNWTRRERALNKQVLDTYAPLIEQAKADGNDTKARQLLRERDQLVRDFGIQLQRVAGPYFPLMRFGDYFVNYKSAEYQKREAALNKASEELRALTNRFDLPTGTEKRIAEKLNESVMDPEERVPTSLTPEQRAELKVARAKVDEAEAALSSLRDKEAHYTSESFETEADATRRAKELNVPVRRASEHFRELNPLSRGFMDRLTQSLEAALPPSQVQAARESLAKLYLQTLPDTSAMKNQMKRENVAGFSKNMTRNIAAYTRREAHYLSRLEHMDDLTSTLMQMERGAKEGDDPLKATELYNEMAKRHVASMNYTETPIQDAIARLSFAYQLGVSPAFLLTNMSQPWMLSAPMMVSRHGMGAVNELGRAFGEVARNLSTAIKQNGIHTELDLSKFKPAERTMLETLQKQGLLDVTMEADLGAYERGGDPTSKTSRFSRALAVAPHQVEVVNRAMTALAAYRMELAKGASADKATTYAQDVLAKTHFDYSNLNAPRPFRPGVLPFGKLITQYRKYQIGVISLLANQYKQATKGATPAERAEARKALLGTVAMHLLVSGAMGIPGATTVLGGMNLAHSIFGDDDEPFDANTEFRNFMAGALGIEGGVAASKGLPALAGLDLSRKVGLGDIFQPVNMGGSQPKTYKDLGKEMLVAGLGPAVGQALNMMEGLDFLGSGQYGKAFEKFLPKSVADVLKAARYSTEGITTKRGDVSIDPSRVDAWDTAVAALGFTPTLVSERGAAVAAVNEAKNQINDRRQELMRDWVQAYTAKDANGVAEARRAIDKFNAARRENGEQIIKPADLLNSYKTRQRGSKSMTEQGVMLSKKDQPLGRRAYFAYVQ